MASLAMYQNDIVVSSPVQTHGDSFGVDQSLMTEQSELLRTRTSSFRVKPTCEAYTVDDETDSKKTGGYRLRPRRGV